MKILKYIGVGVLACCLYKKIKSKKKDKYHTEANSINQDEKPA